MIYWAYPWILVLGAFGGFFVAWWRTYRMQPVTYRYALARFASKEHKNLSSYCLPLNRFLMYTLLILATARPRTPAEHSQVPVEGISIMIALDVSRSMYCFDDIKQPKSRFTIAQEEAIRFIEKRTHDVCGLVIFGAIAATRCPLTSDRRLVIDIVRRIKLGVLVDEGTALSQAIIMGVRRLQASSTKSRILVLLTDGEPSPEDIPHLSSALALAQQEKIRIYTIGIGSPSGGYIYHPNGAILHVESSLHPELLQDIARKTGGTAFEAKNQRELAEIYNTIDRLEKSSQEQPAYTQWNEWGLSLLFIAFLLLLVELGIYIWHIQL